MEKFIYALLFFHCSLSVAQRDRVYVSVDKQLARPGDNIYLKAYVFRGPQPAHRSTSLYMGLYDHSLTLIRQYCFPILEGQAFGMISIPDTLSSGNYWLTAVTRQQLSYDSSACFSLPMYVYNRGSKSPIRAQRPIPKKENNLAGRVKDILWITNIKSDSIASQLWVDSGIADRHLSLVAPLSDDSVLSADFTVGQSHNTRYAFFPVNKVHHYQWLLLFEDSVLIGRQYIHLRDQDNSIHVMADTLDTDPMGYNAWRVILGDCGLLIRAATI